MSCGVGCRCGSALALLWLWHRPVTIALIWPVAWESPYTTGSSPRKGKKTKKKKKRKKKKEKPQWRIILSSSNSNPGYSSFSLMTAHVSFYYHSPSVSRRSFRNFQIRSTGNKFTRFSFIWENLFSLSFLKDILTGYRILLTVPFS